MRRDFKHEMEAKIRKTLDLLVGISVGVLTQLYWGWKWVFIIVGIYSFLKATALYDKIRKTNPQLLMTSEQWEIINSMSDISKKNAQIRGFHGGYATSNALLQFVLTFILVGVLGSMTKIIFSYAIASTIWLSIFIVFFGFLIYSILKKVWAD
ncbi:MAG TPA: hypothetical protein VEA37_12270 [Flavobacterium sp.]|nr:hypothetical protein [Flavobacterium sp.]